METATNLQFTSLPYFVKMINQLFVIFIYMRPGEENANRFIRWIKRHWLLIGLCSSKKQFKSDEFVEFVLQIDKSF